MTAPTLAAFVPDVALAAADSDYYADTLPRLNPADRAAFERAVEAAYNATHAPEPLSYTDRRILQFANRVYRTPGAREQAIRDEFDWSATRYYQRLNALLDRPEAARAYPVLVNRLRRQRAIRQAQRRTNRPNPTRSAA